jgi:hypothetical protein
MRAFKSWWKIGVGFDNLFRSVIVIVEVEVKGGVAKHVGPSRGVEVGQILGRRSNGGKPVIKHDVELTVDVAGGQIENKWNRAGVVC